MSNQNTALSDAVDRFATAMKKKLYEKAQDGRQGWNADNFVDTGACHVRLQEHASRVELFSDAQVVDVANFCMFIFDRHHRPAGRTVANDSPTKGNAVKALLHREPRTREEIGAKRAMVRRQRTEIINQGALTDRCVWVTCPCGRRLSITQAYRCLYCGIYFCSERGQTHFRKKKTLMAVVPSPVASCQEPIAKPS